MLSHFSDPLSPNPPAFLCSSAMEHPSQHLQPCSSTIKITSLEPPPPPLILRMRTERNFQKADLNSWANQWQWSEGGKKSFKLHKMECLKHKSKLEIFKWGTGKTTTELGGNPYMYTIYCSCGVDFCSVTVSVGLKTVTRLTMGSIVVINDKWLHTF